MRWGDVLWQTIAVRLFMQAERFRIVRDFAYEHVSFVSRTISKTGNILGLPPSIAEHMSKKTSQCISYGGLSLGSQPTVQAVSRLHEIMSAKVCREQSFGQRQLRPCVMLWSDDGLQASKHNGTILRFPPIQSVFFGSITEQNGACGSSPEPYYCNASRKRVPQNAFNMVSQNCACNPETARTSEFSRCYGQLRTRLAQWGCTMFGNHTFRVAPVAPGAIGR